MRQNTSVLPRLPFWILTSGAIFLILGFTAVSLQIHGTFNTTAYDLGLFDQGFWRYSQFLPNFNTIRGMNLLGDHFSLIALVFAPLYWIFPSIGWAFLLQTLSVASGGIGLYLLTRRLLPAQPWAALCLALAYGLHPVTHNTLLWQYHEIVLASGLYFALILAYTGGHWRSYVALLLLLLCCREDMPFTIAAFGTLALLERRWRYGLLAIVLALLWWLLVTRWLMPIFNGVGYFRAGQGGVGLLLDNLFNPGFYLARLTDPQSLDYLWKVFLPAGLLGILAPRYLLPAIPTLVANLLIGGYNTQIQYHYSVSIVPFVFWAALQGVQRIAIWRQQFASWAAFALLIGCAAMAWQYSDFHLRQLPEKWQYWNSLSAKRAHVAELHRTIGADGLAADDWLLPHLTHRESAYLFPNPWLTHYWGVAGEQPHHPNRVSYLVLSSGLPPEQQALLDYLVQSKTFVEVSREHDVRLFRRVKAEAEDREQAIAAFRNFSPLPPPSFEHISLSPIFPTTINEFGRLDIDLGQAQRQAPKGSTQIGSLLPGTALELELGPDGQSDHLTRYVRTELNATQACSGRLELGSDDGIAVWHNGAAIHENLVIRGAAPAQDIVPLQLKKGRNVLIFRVNNAGGAWRMLAAVKILRCP